MLCFPGCYSAPSRKNPLIAGAFRRKAWASGDPGRLLSGGINAVMSAECSQTALEAAPDGIEFPLAVVPVELAYHYRGFNGEVLAQIETGNLLTVGLIHNAAVGLGYLAKVLLSLIRLINGYGKGDFANTLGNLGKINIDLLVIALAVAGAVVAHVLYGTALVLKIAVENEFGIRRTLAAGISHEHGGIQVKIGAGIKRINIPAQTDHNLGKPGVALGETDLLTL